MMELVLWWIILYNNSERASFAPVLTFRYQGPKYWLDLPKNIKHVKNLSEFVIQVKQIML